MRTRQENSKHISMGCDTTYVVLDYGHICSTNCLSFTTPGYNYYISTLQMAVMPHTYVCTYMLYVSTILHAQQYISTSYKTAIKIMLLRDTESSTLPVHTYVAITRKINSIEAIV